MPIKCHNRVLLLLACVAIAAVALPFVNVAPNRLMSGEGKALWQVWSFTPGWLAASLGAWVILSLWQGRPAQWLTLLLSEGLFILLFWSAGLAATHMASAESPLARTTIGSGLWLWLALCLLACGTAVSAAAASPVSGLALSGVAMPWDQDVPAESIEAGSYTANMLLGSSQQLSPVVRPRNSTDSVVFISDDTSILTVSNSGVVQAVGVGTTRITAAAGNQICAYTIVVSMDSSMIVTEMDLSLSSNTIYVGNSVSAQLQVRPTSASNYATVALTSSNEKVATVNNFGRVTGIAPGTATITATCGSVTATTNVTVMSIPNSSTGTASTGSSNSGQVVTVNPSYVVLKPGATRTLTASVKPSSASQKFTYKSANSNIATVSPSGVITAVGTGATSITVSNGTASAMVTVIVNRSAASSSDNSSDSSSTEPDNDAPIEIDPVVQAIQDSEDNEIVFTQAEVPTVTGDILNALRTTGKTLCVVGDGYTLQVSGKDVRNTTGELNTSLELQQVEQGLEFVVNDGKTVPCSARIDLDKSDYSRLYLYNETTGKWQYLNSYKDRKSVV